MATPETNDLLDRLERAKVRLDRGDWARACAGAGVRFDIRLRFILTLDVVDDEDASVDRAELEAVLRPDLEALDPVALAHAVPWTSIGYADRTTHLRALPLRSRKDYEARLHLVVEGKGGAKLSVGLSRVWEQPFAPHPFLDESKWRATRRLGSCPLDDASNYGLSRELLTAVETAFTPANRATTALEMVVARRARSPKTYDDAGMARILPRAIELSNGKLPRLKQLLDHAVKDPDLESDRFPTKLSGTMPRVEPAPLPARPGAPAGGHVGSIDERLRDLARSVATRPDDWPLRLRLAHEQMRAGDRDAAAETVGLEFQITLHRLPTLYLARSGQSLDVPSTDLLDQASREEIVELIGDDLRALDPAKLASHMPRAKAGYKLGSVLRLRRYRCRIAESAWRRLCLIATGIEDGDVRKTAVLLVPKSYRGTMMPEDAWRAPGPVGEMPTIR